MCKYKLFKAKDINGKQWFAVIDTDDASILAEPTKYLKHKVKENSSPNTVKRIAYALSYYFCFLAEMMIGIEQILQMKYAEQHEHFVEFLYWLKEGNHCDRNKNPNNSTCNSYLQSIFGFYEFLFLEYENCNDLKVLESRNISYSSAMGVRFRKSIKTFRGYLPNEPSKGRIIKEDNIIKLLEASDSLRNRLLILLLAETGFRIGELLGVKYDKDIDFENRTISVWFREDNENDARAKNAEYRTQKISQETFEILMYYISENRALLKKSEYLFVVLSGMNKGKPLNANAVYSAFGLLEKKTGIKVTPHMLRHYYANERRKSGWTLEMISVSLGHKNIGTTGNYMDIEDSEMSEAMDKYYSENVGLYDINKII